MNSFRVEWDAGYRNRPMRTLLEEAFGCEVTIPLVELLVSLQQLHDKLATSTTQPPTLEMFQADHIGFGAILPILQSITEDELQ